jgi:hypothetical protein
VEKKKKEEVEAWEAEIKCHREDEKPLKKIFDALWIPIVISAYEQ